MTNWARNRTMKPGRMSTTASILAARNGAALASQSARRGRVGTVASIGRSGSVLTVAAELCQSAPRCAYILRRAVLHPLGDSIASVREPSIEGLVMNYASILAILLLPWGIFPAAAGPDTDQMVRNFMLCVRGMAERLEPSEVAPSEVALAAVFMCSEEEVAAANAVLQDRESGISPIKLRDTAEFYGAAQAIIARLCRKTQDCGLAPVK